MAVYGGGQLGAWGLRGGAAFTWHDIDSNRTIAFPGFFDATKASYGAHTAQAFGEIGHAFVLGYLAAAPFAGFAYVHFDGMRRCSDRMALQSKLTNVRQEACARRDVQNSGDTITLDSVCKFGTFVVATHTVITGSFDNAYTARINSKREGDLPMPAGAQSDRTILATGKWLGPCKADQKPGDIITPDGIKTNVKDMWSRPLPTPSQ